MSIMPLSAGWAIILKHRHLDAADQGSQELVAPAAVISADT
jgi:hypothetical protein